MKNQNVKVSSEVTRKVVAFMLAFAMAIVTLSTGPVTAKAATYTQGNQTLTISPDGMAVLTAGSETLQLTDMYVCKDGGMYTSTYPIVLLLWEGNTLFGYCYDIQGKTCELVLLDTKVISLTSSDKQVTGYVTSSGTMPLPTLEQFKAKLNGGSSSGGNSNGGGNNNNNNNNNNNSNNNSGNTTITTGKPVVNGTTVTYSDGSKVYTLSSGKAVIAAANNYDGTSFIQFADGSLYFWNYSLQKGESTITLHKVTDRCNGLFLDSLDYLIGYYDSNGILKTPPTLVEVKAIIASSSASNYSATIEGTTAYLRVLENGYYKKLKVDSSSLLQEVGYDNLGTIYLYYSNKTVKIWNYQLQKGESTKKLLTISTNSTGLAYKYANSDEVSGYYEGSTFKPLWTLDQIRSKLSAMAVSTSTSTSTTASKYVQFYKVKTTKKNGKVTVRVVDTNGETTSKVSFKGNKVYFNGVVVLETSSPKDKILAVTYTNKSKHYILIRTTKRSGYILNRKNGKVVKWRSDVYSFKKTENKFTKKVRLTDGSLESAPNSY